MKIALILDRFDPLRGGLEHWAWQWSNWLLDRGHEVAVVASEARCPGEQSRCQYAPLRVRPPWV
jgi:hypothetical protein